MLAQAERTFTGRQQGMADATASFDFWNSFSGAFGIAIAVLLLIDAFLVPRLVRRCAQTESTRRAAESSEPPGHEVALVGTHEAASLKVHTKFTDVIDAISNRTGRIRLLLVGHCGGRLLLRGARTLRLQLSDELGP